MTNEFYGRYCRPQPADVSCIGHTHIDCAWLWTLRQTREKVQRSFATVLKLMEEYPDYKFTSSQPLLYKYLKEEAPELYEKVKEKIAEGRWECEGAMWVEADCNLPSGE
jgi:alpha-mannosidase